MVVIDVVVNDSGGGHTAETEGQGYGRQAENGAAGQRGQETHWMILPVSLGWIRPGASVVQPRKHAHP